MCPRKSCQMYREDQQAPDHLFSPCSSHLKDLSLFKPQSHRGSYVYVAVPLRGSCFWYWTFLWSHKHFLRPDIQSTAGQGRCPEATPCKRRTAVRDKTSDTCPLTENAGMLLLRGPGSTTLLAQQPWQLCEPVLALLSPCSFTPAP